jgi:acetyl-CoA carboxylase biotin carboxylase subunit
MFRRILIANRGEVAARVTRTCRRLGIEVVAATTEPDAKLQWLQDADVVAHVGGRAGYLDAAALLAAARTHRCSAVHPGWGFLSENARFATLAAQERIRFVGPSPTAIRQMGDKAVAKATMRALGLPLIPGSDGTVADVEEARAVAARIGYPVLLKARAGGGGRGMRRVFEPAALDEAYAQASAESLSAFGDGALYVEKLILRGRHVEFQILGDRHGNLVHLGERECSVQRRHQKLLEESPSPALTPARRAEVGAQVAEACRAAGYVNAGTIEMLMDDDGSLYFMEMNTRLQVEHPVTEMVTGLDLVELQLRVAANEVVRPEPTFRGHAIECRINAEDPDAGFRPAPGRVTRLVLPEGDGIRVDTHLREGDPISPYYDSMIAKVIVHAPTRDAAIARMEDALRSMTVEGVPTTIALHLRILAHPAFRAGTYDTTFLDGLLAG